MTSLSSVARILILFSLVPVFCAAQQNELKLWKDSTEKFTVLAKFVNLNGTKVILKKDDGKEISIDLSRLSIESQQMARDLNKKQAVASTFNELKSLESSVATAKEALVLYEKFMANQYATPDDITKAAEILVELKKAAAGDSVRINGSYKSRDEVLNIRSQSEEEVVAALEAARGGEAKKAFGLLRRAERADETSFLASYVLAMSDLMSRDYSKAKTSFMKCVTRGNKYEKIFPEQMPIVGSAKHNAATVLLLENDFADAADMFADAVKLNADLEDSAVSNLKTALTMIQKKRLQGGEQSVKKIETTLNQLPNGNGIARQEQGWCFVILDSGNPKIDAFSEGTIVGNSFVEFDNLCLNCRGLGHVDCSNRKCAKGTVRKQGYKEFELAGSIQKIRATIPVKCDTCDGKGRLGCRICNKDGVVDYRFLD